MSQSRLLIALLLILLPLVAVACGGKKTDPSGCALTAFGGINSSRPTGTPAIPTAEPGCESIAFLMKEAHQNGIREGVRTGIASGGRWLEKNCVEPSIEGVMEHLGPINSARTNNLVINSAESVCFYLRKAYEEWLSQ